MLKLFRKCNIFGLSFLIGPSVFSNVYLDMHVSLAEINCFPSEGPEFNSSFSGFVLPNRYLSV